MILVLWIEPGNVLFKLKVELPTTTFGYAPKTIDCLLFKEELVAEKRGTFEKELGTMGAVD